MGLKFRRPSEPWPVYIRYGRIIRKMIDWWDDRKEKVGGKLHPKSPDSKQYTTREIPLKVYWTSLRWMPGALHKKTFATSSSGRGSSCDIECRPENAADLKSRQRDENLWFMQISKHIRCGQGRLALRTYEELRRDGVEPCRGILAALLKACSRLQDLESAKQIQADIVSSGLDSDIYLGTMLVDVYIKCGRLVDARQAFEKMPHRNVVSWTIMILGCAQMGKGEEALQLYTQMQQEGVAPNSRTYVGALKACSAMAESGRSEDICLGTVRSIHADAVEREVESDVYVGNMLVDAYAKSGSLEDARRVFENMPCRDVVSWNAMILGYAQRGQGEEALQLYSRMEQEGVVRNDRTYVSALKACSTMGEWKESKCIAGKEGLLGAIRSIHADLMKENWESGLFVGNMLVDAYAKCGSLERARQVFEKMPSRDVVSWNALILGYAQVDKGEEALHLYTRMQDEGVVPNDRTYVSALKACSTIAGVGDRIEGDGLPVNKMCLEAVRAIHTHIVKGVFESDLFVGNMLVDAYAKCGSLEDARRVFEKMPRRTVISWNAMILGYAQLNNGEEALKLYTRMQHEGVVPDGRTYVSVLNACASVAGLEMGKEIHGQIVKADLGMNWKANDLFVTDSLVVMYCKCGSMVDAQQLFDAMPTRGIVACNALIAGYAHQGQSGQVFSLFQSMKLEGVQPDSITFLGVLTLCSHVGLVETGQKYFKAMSRDYGITPNIKHFTCLIDLLGRSGHLDEAMQIVNAMPFTPNTAVWGSVLGACQKWGDVQLGRQAFECAVRFNRDDAAAYVLMSNIYSAAHMLEAAMQVQAMRVKSGVWKQPGRSQWTDMSGITHAFVVGDRGHPETEDIYVKLGDLLVKAKKEGYVSVRT